ncbi:lactate dehydrogenase [Pullulanibacillus camelliae]|uniref:Lactate dehydrogenase n=1 Tax=Pullulanibacillus camelliae TaxID=1707096 RepID=A0A8J3E167_9BACL|nr:Ldh family oxidoreductase [Pullulanibacillus camelliae]GGE53214.1 lactate dehydrogenase [Pullulanibacillus camelliae]
MTQREYSIAHLKAFSKNIFMALGLSKHGATVVSESLIRADLEETPSHGLSRIGIYAKRLKEGRIKASPDIKIEKKGGLLKVDGDNGLGHLVSDYALNQAIPMAREHGILGIFIRNSNHFGTAAYYCQKACREGMALIAMTNTPSAMPPWGGKKPYLGTNPIAFGFPTRSGAPVIIDMSSSVVARGKIILAKKMGKSIPAGWAIDREGGMTTNPEAALEGALLPLGGPKGYALALAVEILSGILTGAAFGPHINNMYNDDGRPTNTGHCFILIHIEKMLDREVYLSNLHQLLAEIKQSPRQAENEEILYPGERRFRSFVNHLHQKLSLSDEVINELMRLGDDLNIPFPSS